MRKLALFLFLTLFVGLQTITAQTKAISGKVIDDLGEALPGVAVVVKGTTNGTTTRFDGTYSLQVPSDATTLVYTFVGMATQDVAIANQSTINVTMASDSEDLDEVVVTALGISKDKKAIGYASTSVGGDEIAAVKSVNPMNALQGKVAGIDISSSPTPGGTQNVIIRGTSSFGSNQPLYVIDGIPMVNSQNRSGDGLNAQADFGSGINALNPDDISDMTVLKGAAATALYGSRAANGVILITTKTGENTDGRMVINYDGSVAVNRVGRLPLMQDSFGQGWGGERALDENGNWGAKYDGGNRVWGNVVDGEQLSKTYEFQDDRIRDFYDLGLNYKNAVSASGGNENTNYFFSVSNNSVDGVYPGAVDTYDRTTLSTRGSHKYGKATISSSINFSNEQTQAVPSGQGTSVFRSLLEVAEEHSLVDMEDYNNKFYNLDNYFTPYGVNPYYPLNEDNASQDKNKFFGKVQFDRKFINDKLNVMYRFGGDYESSVSETWLSQIHFSEDAPNATSQSARDGEYEKIKRVRYETNHDGIVSFTDKFGEISFSGLVGFNASDRFYSRLNGKVDNLDLEGVYNLSNGTAPSTSEQYEERHRLVGVFANVDLGFRNYAYLTLTARNDWSSTLPAENNSFFYPGVTGSFLFSEFLKQSGNDTGVMKYGKLRVAYGSTGKDALPYYVNNTFVGGYSYNPGYPNVSDLEMPLGGVNSWTRSTVLADPNLKPEITKEFEIGLEMNFFQGNRLGFDFSFYDRVTYDLIEELNVDRSSGFNVMRSNVADVKNTGIELVVTGTPIRTSNFSWDISANYSQNKNEVLSLNGSEVSLGGFSSATIVAIEGEEMGLFKTTVPLRDDQGRIVVDGQGIPQSDPDQQVHMDKSINEKFRVGLTNTFTYKNISLSGVLDYRHGGYMYSYTKDYLGWTGAGYFTTENDRNTFIVPNSVQLVSGQYVENTTPISSSNWHTYHSDGGTERGEAFLMDKSYLKLRNISLSYNLPRDWFEKLKIQNAKVSFVASNILLWTPEENPYIDPEVTTFGNDIAAKFGEYGAAPTNEVYTFSLGLTF